MANVGFKIGTQAALNDLITNGGAVAGTFFLTNDTNRLYISKENGSIKPINAGIITVLNTEALPKVNELSEEEKKEVANYYYYASQPNILCVFDGTRWVQINSIVTNDSLTNSVSTDDNITTVSTTITDSSNVSKSDSYTITGANGITVSSDSDTKAITITGDPITIATTEGSNSATTTFKSASGTTNGSLGIAGSPNVTVTAANNVITIAAKDTINESVTIANNDTSGFNITVTESGNKSVTGQLNPEIKIGKTTEGSIKFVNGVADLNVYTIDEVNGLFDNFDDKLSNTLQGFNAMEYQGTVGSNTADHGLSLPTSNVKSGYAYLVTGDTFKGADGQSYPAGTLVVAHGSENEYGFLNPINWSYVTGSAADTQYTGSAISGGITLLRNTDDAAVMTLTAQAGDIETSDLSGVGSDIIINAPATPSTSQTLTFAHKKYSDSVSGTNATDQDQPNAMTAVSTYDIPVISGITVSNGHVTGYTVKTYKVTDTNASLSISTKVSDDSDNTATVTQTFTMVNGANEESTPIYSNFTIASSSLNITDNNNDGDGDGIVINLTWGTF